MDKERIEKAVREILFAIGENPDREGLKETPIRVAQTYEHICSGIGRDPAKEIKLFEEKSDDGMVIVKDISFYSLCEHHLLPFFGQLHIAYIPRNGQVSGLSKIVRVVDTASRKLQLQERLAKEIGKAVMTGTNALGVAVVIQAEHLCMTMRGVSKPGTKTITTDFQGVFKTDAVLRTEALHLLQT